MVNKAVSNTGPILHLTEINFIKAFDIFSIILIPQAVASELRKRKAAVPSKVKIYEVKGEWKDMVKILTNQNDLDLGESFAIALSLQEKANYFLTDDLDARSVAREYNLEVHGTVGIILRAFRNGIIDKKNAIEMINRLHSISSLFITRDLTESIIKEINDYK